LALELLLARQSAALQGAQDALRCEGNLTQAHTDGVENRIGDGAGHRRNGGLAAPKWFKLGPRCENDVDLMNIRIGDERLGGERAREGRLKKKPSYALAYAGLADDYSMLVGLALDPPKRPTQIQSRLR
jgi:hypothetical protein